MFDGKNAADGKVDGSPENDLEKKLDAKQLEPFGNEETAEIKYRTMKWWYVIIVYIKTVNSIMDMANHPPNRHCGMRE